MTNTPELDKDGKPVVPGGEETVTLTKAEYDELVRSNALKAQAEASLTTEVIDLRKKNADLKKLPDDKVVPSTDVQKVVQEEFAKKEAEQAKANFESASATFLSGHPEFSKENDPGGIKFSAFQRSLSRINLSALKSVDEFTEALSDAYSLMDRKASVEPLNSSSPRYSPAPPKASVNNQLSPSETTLVKNHFNGDTDAYLKAKAKKPAYFEELLKWAR